jgi:endonuclease YncB( thermonuclease family)
VQVRGEARDQHGRLLGTLWVDGRDINRELVAEGLAWVFGGFAPDEALLEAEAEARRQRRGLWSDPKPIAPADWRAMHPPHR